VAYDFFSRGFDVWTYDHRGQGFSQRELENTQIGWVESFQNYVNDLDIFYNRIVASQKKKNFYIIAHSMGAAVTALWLAQSQLKPTAVMLTAPMIDLILKPYPRFVVAAMVAAGLRSGRDKQYVPGSQDFQFSDYGFDLTNSTARRNWNRNLFAVYPALRLGGPSFQWLHEALQVPRRLRTVQFPDSVNCPILVFQAGSDQVVKPNAQIHLRSKNSHFVMAYEPHGQHELLQEQDDIRARVINKTLHFFEQAAKLGETV
jgi:lysophospholipase